jgi:hypothetical protein
VSVADDANGSVNEYRAAIIVLDQRKGMLTIQTRNLLVAETYERIICNLHSLSVTPYAIGDSRGSISHALLLLLVMMTVGASESRRVAEVMIFVIMGGPD